MSGRVRQHLNLRMRRSEDEGREQQRGAAGLSSAAYHPSVTAKDLKSAGFVFGLESTNHQQVLLLPIELQPPSPPWAFAQSSVELTTMITIATPKSKSKELTSNSTKDNTRSLASVNGIRHAHHITGTLSSTFSAVPSSPLSASGLAPLRTSQPTSTSTLSSSLSLGRRIRLHRQTSLW